MRWPPVHSRGSRTGWRWLALVTPLSVAAPVAAQPATPCVRIAFGAWTPPLDWAGAGHSDSSARIASRIEQRRDSVFNGATRGGGDEMVWTEESGQRRLTLFPSWWPAGVVITFPRGALGDTLQGEAAALVADLSRPQPRARARVLRTGCTRPR
jgi:hypothetical protein